MCGRFVRKSGAQEIAREFNVELSEIRFLLEPNYNIAPGNDVAVVVRRDRKVLEGFRWGFIPNWSKDEKIGYRMINARGETISQKPAFKKAFTERRCLIVADGFYEWLKGGKKPKPYYFRMKDGSPMGLAGIYETWRSPKGILVNSCSIITTASNSLMKPIHERMPAIIGRKDHFCWLDNSSFVEKKLSNLIKPFPEEFMEYYPVGTFVNSTLNNSEKCIEPLTDETA